MHGEVVGRGAREGGEMNKVGWEEGAENEWQFTKYVGGREWQCTK